MPRVDRTTAVPAPPPAAAPMTAPFLPPTSAPMMAPPAAGAPILSASFFFVAAAVRATGAVLMRVAFVVAARRQRIEIAPRRARGP